LKQYLKEINRLDLHPRTGKVLQYVGLVIEASGPDVHIGDICQVFPSNQSAPIYSEVVGFRDGRVLLMPFGKVKGVSLGSEVVATGHSASINVSMNMLGRVIDAFGRPLDGKGPIDEEQRYPLYLESHNPMSRQRIDEMIQTQVKVIDLFTPIGKGQRLGIFAGSGVGKSSLLGMFAKNIETGVNVIALIGERGREVKDFVEDVLGESGMKNSVVIVATADQPALVRTHAVYAALAISEYFCDMGKDVLLTLDSITRFAMAQREIGLAVGEPPTTRGYTPSVFSSLSPIVERAGNFEGKGSISALYTVLVEGDDLNDPVSDYMRGILDGHIVLSRHLSNKGVYPSVDILKSKSRLFNQLTDKSRQDVILKALKLLSDYEQAKDMIEIGAYENGSNTSVDQAIKFMPQLLDLIQQTIQDSHSSEQAFKQLAKIIGDINGRN
jgi:flagellum-specific ATP synthase